MWYKKSIPEFKPSKFWSLNIKEAQVIEGLPDFEKKDVDAYSNSLAELATFHGNANELFQTQNVGKNMMGFDSLYLAPTGEFFLIHPHTHDMVSRDILRAVHPELPATKENSKYQKGGGYSHVDLTKLSGIQRVQIYSDGMGITIEMTSPPNTKQLNAIRDAYMLTPMKRFVAEISFNGEMVASLTSFRELVHFVNNFDPKNPYDKHELNSWFGI
jgi:hypothetical protein